MPGQELGQKSMAIRELREVVTSIPEQTKQNDRSAKLREIGCCCRLTECGPHTARRAMFAVKMLGREDDPL